MNYTIENNLIKAAISSKGAELQSLTHKNFSLEYMWSGDAAVWGKKSPVLFPIVGGLKENTYQYNGGSYKMSRHGFARDMEFELTFQNEISLIFTLQSNDETMPLYPFPFSFSVKYALDKNELTVTYIVENKGADKMFFSVGGHPAFKVPLTAGTTFNDYYLQFSATEALDRWPLSARGLIDDHTESVTKYAGTVPLTKELFYQDALVFKQLTSKYVFIRSNKTTHGIKVHINGFPYLGIWSAKDADFVCVEPWYGIADNINTSGNIEEKEGMNKLEAAQKFEKSWSVELF